MDNYTVYSTMIRAGRVTYFVDVKEAKTGKRYVSISQAGIDMEGNRERKTLRVFAESIESFEIAIREAKSALMGIEAAKKDADARRNAFQIVANSEMLKGDKEFVCGVLPPALLPEGDEGCDYVLQGSSCWVTVGDISLWIRRDGCDGVIVEAYEHFKEMENPIESMSVEAP